MIQIAEFLLINSGDEREYPRGRHQFIFLLNYPEQFFGVVFALFNLIDDLEVSLHAAHAIAYYPLSFDYSRLPKN